MIAKEQLGDILEANCMMMEAVFKVKSILIRQRKLENSIDSMGEISTFICLLLLKEVFLPL